jgi:aryl-alcohol dehydrogenase-like predicted oxidoreductase
MERHRFGNSDLTVSAVGLGCYGTPGVYGRADDAKSIATIRYSTTIRYSIGQMHRETYAVTP